MAQAAALAEATLDEIRLALAPVIAEAAAFDGWSNAAVESAATQRGVDPAVARAAAAQMREGDAESARLHLESVKRILTRSQPEFAH